nr:hypothetical protein CFP56_74979 [Quercus suber]
MIRRDIIHSISHASFSPFSSLSRIQRLSCSKERIDPCAELEKNRACGPCQSSMRATLSTGLRGKGERQSLGGVLCSSDRSVRVASRSAVLSLTTFARSLEPVVEVSMADVLAFDHAVGSFHCILNSVATRSATIRTNARVHRADSTAHIQVDENGWLTEESSMRIASPAAFLAPKTTPPPSIVPVFPPASRSLRSNNLSVWPVRIDVAQPEFLHCTAPRKTGSLSTNSSGAMSLDTALQSRSQSRRIIPDSCSKRKLNDREIRCLQVKNCPIHRIKTWDEVCLRPHASVWV